MKKGIKIILSALFLTAVMQTQVNAQTKIGYIDMNHLIDQMPESITAKNVYVAFQKQLTDQLNNMYAEIDTKNKTYQVQKATMTDAVRLAKEGELSDLQNRIQEFTEKAKSELANKQAELSKPIVEKARQAALAVADEKGYTYLLDSSEGMIMKAPAGDDLTIAVKSKLGIK